MGRDSHFLRFIALIAVICAAAAIASGCAGEGSASAESGPVQLGFMTWKDSTPVTERQIKRCEERSGGKYKLEQIAMGPTTDAAREQLTRRLAAEDETMDILNLDVIWTAEFSDAGWLYDLTDRVTPIADKFVPAPLESAKYKDKYWAVPVGTNAALLYYRSDIIDTPPTTWQEMAQQAKTAVEQNPNMTGFVFQGKSYEGGTVDAIEFIAAAGGSVLSDDGTSSALAEGDAAVQAFEFVGSLIPEGVSTKTVSTFVEEDTRLTFQRGTAVFMRNWPYAYALMNSDDASKVKGKFDVVPLPKFEGQTSASVLGGQNYAISSYSDSPEMAWEAIECLSDAQSQVEKAIEKGELPTLESVYLDENVQRELPFIDKSYDALATAVNRPATPYYNDVTISIYKAWNDVVAGRVSASEAVETMNHGVQKAVEGEALI